MSERLHFGDFTVEPSLQRLTRAGSIVALKPKAYDLLCLLLANRDRVVGKNELLDWLWPRQEISESNLSQTLYELRRALVGHAANWVTLSRRTSVVGKARERRTGRSQFKRAERSPRRLCDGPLGATVLARLGVAFLGKGAPFPAKRALIRASTVALNVTQLAAWPTRR